jgi:transposase
VYVEQDGIFALEYLPPYAPDLNPVECIWGYLRSHAMPNFCEHDTENFGLHASSRFRSMQHRTTRVTAYWKQPEPI